MDNDPQALLATRDNAQRNNIKDEQLITYLPHEAPKDLQADVMVANILAAPLIELAPVLCDMTQQKRLAVLSRAFRSTSRVSLSPLRSAVSVFLSSH